MIDLCKHCEYGNRFIDLGKCPECVTGRIVGDLHTKDIFCSNLHYITKIAIDFCGKKNCYGIFETEYKIKITSHLSREQLVNIGKYIDRTPIEIYKALKNEQNFFEKLNFYELLKICKYLYENTIEFKISPDFPLLCNFENCFPELVKDYQQIFKFLYQ